MVFLLMYAVAIWAVAVVYRRRWLSFVVVIAALLPVALATHLTVRYTAKRAEQAAITGTTAVGGASLRGETWLYPVGAAYGGLILGVGLLIAVQPRTVAVEEPCPVCDYELKGVTAGTCPECGHDRAMPARAFRPAPAASPVAPPDDEQTQAARDHLRHALAERERDRRRDDALDRGLRPPRGRASLDPSG
ncbi:MAG: hypothetical protein ACF8QF_03035 [Phycisphaerales bacterium]